MEEGPKNMQNVPANILDGTSWWARIEKDQSIAARQGLPFEANQQPQYAKVIAWERVSDLHGEEGQHGMVAWLNGNHPFRSDRVKETTREEFFFHYFTQSPPKGFKEFIWA